jgi:hypothetical protein
VSGETARPRWLVATVAGLLVMIVWTVVVKYVAPLHWFWAERLAGRAIAAPPVMWDLWPLAHAAMAVGLWRGARWAWGFGVAVSAAEIAVVATKFFFYLRAPELDFWRLLWFTNKLYVILFFACALYVLLGGPGRAHFARAEAGR